MTTTRRNLLVASASMGAIGKVIASSPLQVQQSFKGKIIELVIYINPWEDYIAGKRAYVGHASSIVDILAPYGLVGYDDFGDTSKISLTPSADANIGNYRQCVGFVKVVSTPVVSSDAWIGSPDYISSVLPPPFSPIAVFGTLSNPHGTSFDRWGGNGHVAIFIGQLPDGSGIAVLDQNHDNHGSIAVRTMLWSPPSGTPRTLNPNNYRRVMI